MAFIRGTSPAYFAPAEFTFLDGEGRLTTQKFDVQFKRLKKSELVQLDADMATWREERTAGAAIDADRRVLNRVMVGWRGVQEPDGTDMAFSLEALDRVEEEFPGFVGVCVKAFFLSTSPGQSAHLAAEKN